MIIIDEERPSDSPFVERIWRSHSEGTAPFLSIAVSRCELVVTKLHGKITMTVRGPETKATPLGDSPSGGVVWHSLEVGYVSDTSTYQKSLRYRSNPPRSSTQHLLAL